MNRLDIIYEDAEVLVVRKPAGLAVQTKRLGQKDLESMLKNHLAKKGKQPYIGMIHRLDQPVEGILVFAKTPKAAAVLSAQAAEKIKGMKKEYLAVVCGNPDQPKGTLCDWLKKNGKTNLSSVVTKGTSDAKEAVLDYEVLKYKEEEKRALVKINLKTGRHHQIRVQMAHAGMPLYGDSKYNPEPGGGAVALCAFRLTFVHPASKKTMTFECNPKNPAFEGFEGLK